VKGSRNNHCKAKKRECTTFTKQLLLAGRGREKRRDGDAKQQRSAASRYGVGDIRLVRPSRTAPLTVWRGWHRHKAATWTSPAIDQIMRSSRSSAGPSSNKSRAMSRGYSASHGPRSPLRELTQFLKYAVKLQQGLEATAHRQHLADFEYA
jgi:hypothetical protein